jgi:hypothetical protein
MDKQGWKHLGDIGIVPTKEKMTAIIQLGQKKIVGIGNKQD